MNGTDPAVWPGTNDAAVRRATRVLARGGEGTAHAREVLAAAGLPELMSTIEVAELLGTSTANLKRWVGIPAPLYRLRVGALWDAVTIRRWASERAKRLGSKR